MIERRALQDGQESRAWYSACETYRYGLTRRWQADAPALLYIMLNPSTATEQRNDPTIERCQRRAQALGFGELRIANLFAFRATRPEDLRRAPDPVGPDNAEMIARLSKGAGMTLAAWGVHGALLDAGPKLAAALQGEVHHLGLTKNGHPRHPLYVSYKVQPTPWPADDRLRPIRT
ncbi:DUF1643 domain-containing protein [Cognatishimia sp. F0-27]|uniref:DUF1643 domain-containing protein n=1 Tax=Cognatishimia sp. F0-27 TaxID=2816855 RepID=UPI001D0CC260|nr:DUF1643 domain-containing protein [Cognatishimia sp. F0-27]MCC1491928.1 DUF1643 domain-containing protein [Cognatishimia sp. F0-27]